MLGSFNGCKWEIYIVPRPKSFLSSCMFVWLQNNADFSRICPTKSITTIVKPASWGPLEVLTSIACRWLDREGI